VQVGWFRRIALCPDARLDVLVVSLVVDWSCNGLDGKQTYDVKALLRSTVGDTFAYKFGLDGQKTPTPAHSYSYWYGSDEDLHSPTATIGPQNYQSESLIFSVECHNYYTDCTIELQDLQMPDSAKNGNSTMTTTAMGPVTVHNTSFRAVAGDGGPPMQQLPLKRVA